MDENVHATCGGPISIIGHTCKSHLKAANLNESRYTPHKYAYLESKLNLKSTLCTTSIHLEASNVQFWCIMLV